MNADKPKSAGNSVRLDPASGLNFIGSRLSGSLNNDLAERSIRRGTRRAGGIPKPAVIYGHLRLSLPILLLANGRACIPAQLCSKDKN